MAAIAGEGTGNGKLIMLGEHAVVYGVPALVCGIGRGLRATATASRTGSSLSLSGEHCLPDASATALLPRALAALLGARAGLGEAAGVSLRIDGDLPPGMGLGFSAAAGVAAARAVEALAGGGDPLAVSERAMAWERVFHGNPSGVDVAAAMHGGALRFVRGAGATALPVGAPLALCVGLTGVGSSTRTMVDRVAAARARDPSAFARVLAEVAALVETAAGAIASADASTLGRTMSASQALLAGWGLETEAIGRLCEAALGAGALGAKLTGSGGGGAVIALVGPCAAPDVAARAAAVIAAWRALGYDGFEVTVGQTSAGGGQ